MTTARPGSFTILRVAFAAIRLHPRLLWFPALSLLFALGLSSLAIVVSLIFPDIAGQVADHAGHTSIRIRAGLAGSFFAVYGVGLAASICNVALSGAAMEAMAGREFTIRGRLRHAWSRIAAIATVFAIGTWIRGRLGRRKRGGRGSLAGSLLGAAWWAVSYLVVPVLARERKGGFESLLRSAKLFRDTWKEAFIGRIAVGWITVPFGLLVAATIALCGLLGIDGASRVVLIALPVAAFGIALLLVRTLDVVYRTALYVFATEGVVPEPFDDAELHGIWEVPRVIEPDVEDPDPAST
jgi:hypothetical protein